MFAKLPKNQMLDPHLWPDPADTAEKRALEKAIAALGLRLPDCDGRNVKELTDDELHAIIDSGLPPGTKSSRYWTDEELTAFVMEAHGCNNDDDLERVLWGQAVGSHHPVSEPDEETAGLHSHFAES